MYARQVFAAAATALALGISPPALAAGYEPGLMPFGSYAAVRPFLNRMEDGGEGHVTALKNYSYVSQFDILEASAVSSLAGGILKASSLTVSADCDPGPFSPCLGIGVSAYAAMWDTVHFAQVDGSPLQSVALAPVSLEIDGVLQGHYADAKLRSYWGFTPLEDPDDLPWINLDGGQTDILDILLIPGSTAPLFFYAELWVQSGSKGVNGEVVSIADFGNTLHFNWDLPEGVVAHSASGVFMTDLTSAVPEPATWAMMIAGFGLVGAALRRRSAPLAA